MRSCFLFFLLLVSHQAAAQWTCQVCVPTVPPPPPATTYYIDKASIGGACSDNNVGDIAHPWCSWTANMWDKRKKLLAGDAVIIRAGTYFERMNIAADALGSGTAARPILIAAYGTEKVIFDGSTVSGVGILEYGAHNYLSFKNLELRNYAVCLESDGTVTKTGWTMEGIDAHHCGRGLLFRNYNGIILTNIKAHDTNGNGEAIGIGFSSGSTGISISSVQSYNHNDQRGSDGDADGIWADESTGKITITDAITYGNTEDGIDLKSRDVTLTNIKSYGNNACGIKLWNGTAVGSNIEIYGNGEDGLKVSGATVLLTALNSHDNVESAFQWRSTGGTATVKASTLKAGSEAAVTFVTPDPGIKTKMDISDTVMRGTVIACGRVFTDAQVLSGELNTFLATPNVCASGSVVNPK